MRIEEHGADSLEHIRSGVFGNDDLLTRDTINSTFDQMDEEIWRCLSYILDAPTRFVENRLSEVAIRSMGNMTYNRVLFNKDEYTPEEWMTLSGRLLHLTATRKTLANIAETKEVLQQMLWVRAMYEELAEDFLRITEGYSQMCVEEAILCTSLRASFGAKLGSLRLGKDAVERATGLDQARLYGTARAVRYHYDRYLDLRNIIIQPYLRLVFAEASKLSGNSRSITEDVFQAGVFGLIRAISTFFRERQTYFSGYARWWVRQAILLALKEEVSFFKIPSAIWHVYNKMERGEKIEENNDKIRQYVNVIKLVPIDQPVQQDGNTARLLDTLIDVDQEIATEEQELGFAVVKMLEKLEPDAERYLCLKFGIISHLQTRSDLSESDILKEQLRQTLALMRFHTTVE
jgi:RNA polymerase sigma factor (sigma-70 family)